MLLVRFLSFCLACFLHRMDAIEDPDVVPKEWPQAFNVTFFTNIVSEQHAQNRSDIDTRRPIKSKLFYDYANYKSQRIQHGAGSYECIHFYNTLDECTLIMKPTGMFRLLPSSNQDALDCCLDLPAVTCPPPTWPVSAAEGREYVGDEVEKVSGVMAHHWRWPMGEGSYSHYFQDIETNLPVKWTFPAANGRQDFYFIAGSFLFGPQDGTLFELPSPCTKCPEEPVSLSYKHNRSGEEVKE